MDELIEALRLVKPYMTDYGKNYPTHCEHDVMFLNVEYGKLPADVVARLDELSFSFDEDYDSLTSFKFGSC